MTVPAPYTPEEQETQRIAKFQSLQAGQYWRAKVPTNDQGIEAGVVLLIESIRWVDDAAHTIILRPHPSKYGRPGYFYFPKESAAGSEVEVNDDGEDEVDEDDVPGMDRVWCQYGEHRFLLNDFLAKFEFEPDHQAIRQREITQLQGKISELQSELVETQANPALLALVVEKGLREQAEAQTQTREAKNHGNPPGGAGTDKGVQEAQSTELAIPTESTVAMATGTVSSAITAGVTPEAITALKAAAGREYEVATIKAKWIQSKTTAIATVIKQMTPYYEEQAAAALAATEDVREYVAKLLEGIESLDLYVGKNVEVVTIATGESAAKDIPLTFAQKKLLMDEELAVYTDVDEWFDFSKESLFFEALRAHPGLVRQIFPSERCVLVMAITRRYIDYGDNLTNLSRNNENRKVFLLVRDGQNIHQVFSPVESHLGTARLFPTKDDQQSIFRGLDGSKIKFEDVAYTDSLEKHELFALHYKRFLLLCCGLDHRLKLFGDFYDGPPTMHFVSMAFQEQHCRFLHDDDAGQLLPSEERPSVNAWMKQKNDFLRSGSRVLCNWEELMNPDTAPSACKEERSSHHGRRWFDRTYRPGTVMDVAIAYKAADSVCVDVQVKGYSYSKHEDREFTCRVNLSKFSQGRWYNTDQAMLCLDMVEPDELYWYIHNRGMRENHLNYIRFFKTALKLIEAERATEQPMRQQLAQAMAEGGIGQPQERDSIIRQTVAAWRSANRGKPLPTTGAGASKAVWKALLDQMYMLAGEGARRVAEVEQFVRGLGLEPLRISLTGKAKLLAYAAPAAHERDDRVEPHAWVHQITVELGANGCTEHSRSWAAMSRSTASETVLQEWAPAKEWCDLNSPFGTYERKTMLIALVEACRERLARFGATLSQADFEEQMEDWVAIRDTANEKARVVKHPVFAVPVGLVYESRNKGLQCLLVGGHMGHGLLGRLAPTEGALHRLRKAFTRIHANEAQGGLNFDREVAKASYEWVFMTMNPKDLGQVDPVFRDSDQVRTITQSRFGISPLLKDKLTRVEKYMKSNGEQIWLAENAKGADGALHLDSLLGITLPKDYEPMRVRHVTLHHKSAQGRLQGWCDLMELQSVSSDPEGMALDEAAKSVIAQAVGSDEYSFSATYEDYMTRREAMDSIQRLGLKKKFSLVEADAHNQLPTPPPGAQRWYLLRPESSGATA